MLVNQSMKMRTPLLMTTFLGALGCVVGIAYSMGDEDGCSASLSGGIRMTWKCPPDTECCLTETALPGCDPDGLFTGEPCDPNLIDDGQGGSQ